jgi:hypothetical protein
MIATVVDVFPDTSSLDSQRGILIEGLLVLPDQLCPGEVLVRLRSALSSTVHVIEHEEIEIENDLADEAVKNHVYNVGWFGGFFRKAMEEVACKKTKGN